MLTLSTNDVHIHLQSAEFFNSSHLNCLDVIETQRAQAFKFDKDRDLYVAAHVFLRKVLSRYAQIPEEKWEFMINAYGKPAVANLGYEWLKFNLSHTEGLIACIVSVNRDVGVDVEKHKRINDLYSLCRHAFSSVETDFVIATASYELQLLRFFNFWTLKEAYIKARGLGLSLPLQHFSFMQGIDQNWRIHYDPQFQKDEKNWQFNTWYLNKNYYLASCVEIEKLETEHQLSIRLI